MTTALKYMNERPGFVQTTEENPMGRSTCCINYLIGTGEKDRARSFLEAHREKAERQRAQITARATLSRY